MQDGIFGLIKDGNLCPPVAGAGLDLLTFSYTV